MPSELTCSDIETDIFRAATPAQMTLVHSAICGVLSNQRWQKDPKTDVSPDKMHYYRQVVEAQITRVVEDKLKDPSAILEKQVGIDYNFIVQLNELHNSDVKLSSLNQQLQQYLWLKQSLLKMANLPFMQNDNELQSAPIKHLEHALPFLGVNAAQVIVPHALMKHSMKIPQDHRLYDIDRRLINYGLSLASTAYRIAELTGTGDPQAAYTGGILKALSYIVVYKLFLETYGEVRQANIALARKQLNKNLLDGMTHLAPQRDNLCRLFESKADSLASDLLYFMSGKYLKMHSKTHWAAKHQDCETWHQRHTSSTSLAIKQAVSYCNVKLLLREKIFNEQDARLQLAAEGVTQSLADLLLRQHQSSLTIFRRNRLQPTKNNNGKTTIFRSSNSEKSRLDNGSRLFA